MVGGTLNIDDEMKESEIHGGGSGGVKDSGERQFALRCSCSERFPLGKGIDCLLGYLASHTGVKVWGFLPHLMGMLSVRNL